MDFVKIVRRSFLSAHIHFELGYLCFTGCAYCLSNHAGMLLFMTLYFLFRVEYKTHAMHPYSLLVFVLPPFIKTIYSSI